MKRPSTKITSADMEDMADAASAEAEAMSPSVIRQTFL